MGCVQSNTQPSISLQIRQLNIIFQHQIMKIQTRLQNCFDEYQKTLNSGKYRHKDIQYSLLSQAAVHMNMQHINKIAAEHCKRLISYQHLLTKDKKSDFQLVKPDLEMLLFIQSILQNEKLSILAKHAKSRYANKGLKENDKQIMQKIDDEILRHHKLQPTTATQKMVNQCAMKLCQARELSLETMNESGNNFRYI